MSGKPNKTAVVYRSAWIPQSETALLPAGRDFDAIRVRGPLAYEIAVGLCAAAGGEPGPVVLDNPYRVDRNALMYFLLRPGAASRRWWPPAVAVLDRPTQHVGVPALWGNTWPLAWWSRPTSDVRFVDAGLLNVVAGRLAGWGP